MLATAAREELPTHRPAFKSENEELRDFSRRSGFLSFLCSLFCAVAVQFFGRAFCFRVLSLLSFMSSKPTKPQRPTIKRRDGLWPWQDGTIDRMTQYNLYMASPFWLVKRAICLSAENHRCASCEKRGRLTVHHITYERMFRELPSDLMALCWKCHKKAESFSKGKKPRPTRDEILDFLGKKSNVPQNENPRHPSSFAKWAEECEDLGEFTPFHGK